MQKWNQESIGLEILRMFEIGEPLNYSAVAHRETGLLRAATRVFGSWRAAIEFAGLNYDDIRRYKSWNRDHIVDRIRELNEKGEDLSWRHISTRLDPQLAAAAIREQHFGSWQGALSAAGLDYDTIRRYRDWDEDVITQELREKHSRGADLNAKYVQQNDVSLITAARRRFESWDRALTAAGLDHTKIALRSPWRRSRSAGSRAAKG